MIDPLLPTDECLGGFMVRYDADVVAPGETIEPTINLTDSTVLQDPDKAPAVEVFMRDQRVVSVRLNLTGYYVIPKHLVAVLALHNPP